MVAADESGSTTVVRVVLVDDHLLFLDALGRRLRGETTIIEVGRASSSVQARRVLSSSPADVLVLDAELDDGAGIALGGRLLADELVAAMVVVGPAHSVEAAARAVRAGARGFVGKREDSVDDLIATILAVHAGETRLPTRLLSGIREELQRSTREDDELHRRLELLTAREREVLALLASGADRHAISARLFISAHTVRTHLQRILTKLDVHSQLEAVSVALRAGLQLSTAEH